jgi:hypothetical protein
MGITHALAAVPPHEVDGQPGSASMVFFCRSALAWRFLGAFVRWLPPRANFSVVGALPSESRIFTPRLQVGRRGALIFPPNTTCALIYARCMLHLRVCFAK